MHCGQVSFGLVPGRRSRQVGRLGGRSSRVFDDFLIDGLTLTDRLNDVLAADDPEVVPGTRLHDDIPVCVIDFDMRDEIEQLLPSSVPGSARARLLICPECADPGCGSLMATVDVTEDAVIWRDFVIEDDLEPRFHHLPVPNLGPFAFEREAYTAVLRAFIDRWPDRCEVREQQAADEEERAADARKLIRSESRRRWKRWLSRSPAPDPLIQTVIIEPDWVN